MKYESIIDSFDVQVVSEMAIGEGTLVPLPKDVIEEINEQDDNPKFATFMIESGFSKAKRNWRPEILEKISEQINSASDPVVGYLGHIKPGDEGYVFPEIQLHWLRSRCARVGDKVRMYAKAYVLPEGKGRTYISRKLVNSVSISGEAAMKPVTGGVDVIDFDLESIDLARPRKAGMRTALVGGLTSEMEEGSKEVDKAEIAALTANELRAHNPSLVEAIESDARKPLETKVTEMETENTELKTEADLLAEIRLALGIDANADLLESVGAMLSKIKEVAKGAKDKVFDEVLAEKFKDENTRGLVKLALTSEMKSTEISDDSDESKKKVSEMVDKAVEDHEFLKAMVTEEQGSGGSSFTPKPVDRGTREIKPGYSNENIEVRARR
jgi:hypothetical protein